MCSKRAYDYKSKHAEHLQTQLSKRYCMQQWQRGLSSPNPSAQKKVDALQETEEGSTVKDCMKRPQRTSGGFSGHYQKRLNISIYRTKARFTTSALIKRKLGPRGQDDLLRTKQKPHKLNDKTKVKSAVETNPTKM